MNTRTLFAVRTQRALLVTTLLVAAFAPRFVPAQGTRTFDSGSTGADGALTFAVPAGSTVTFDPTTFDPPLDPDGDNVFHFTTECFTTSGVEIGCADPFHPCQDGSFQLGCPRAGRFVVVDEETVADTCLGLLWKRRPIDRDVDGFLDYNIDGYTWQEALQHCTRLGEGWRLPNVMELQSLVDYGEMATLDPQLFPLRHTPGLERWHGEWTSTSNPAAPQEAYLVIVGSFLAEAERGGSQTISYPKIDGRILVRAVRSLR